MQHQYGGGSCNRPWWHQSKNLQPYSFTPKNSSSPTTLTATSASEFPSLTVRLVKADSLPSVVSRSPKKKSGPMIGRRNGVERVSCPTPLNYRGEGRDVPPPKHSGEWPWSAGNLSIVHPSLVLFVKIDSLRLHWWCRLSWQWNICIAAQCTLDTIPRAKLHCCTIVPQFLISVLLFDHDCCVLFVPQDNEVFNWLKQSG